MASLLSEIATWRERLREDLFGRVLPFWAENSFDAVNGGFYNCLDRRGDVYDSHKYMWMQGRQAWMFTTLALEYGDEIESLSKRHAAARRSTHTHTSGCPTLAPATAVSLRAADLTSAALRCVDFMQRFGYERAAAVQVDDAFAPFPTSGRVYFNLNREGVPAGMQRQPFAASFFALALAGVARAGNASARAHACALVERLLTWTREPFRLGREALPGAAATGCDPLNVAMILMNLIDEVNAGLPLDEWRYAEEQEWAFKSVMEHHVAVDGVVRAAADARNVGLPPTPARLTLEWVKSDGGLDLSTPAGRTVNPGHGIEAGWFLLQHVRSRAAAGADMSAYPSNVVETALDMIESNFDYGWDAGNGGGILYFRDVAGWTPTQLEWDMKLWWPMAEAMVAFAAAFAHTLQPRYFARFTTAAQWVYDHLCDEEFGEWYGYAARDGRVTHDFKGGPYKGCFHVPRALYMCDVLLREAEVKLQAAAAKA